MQPVPVNGSDRRWDTNVPFHSWKKTSRNAAKRPGFSGRQKVKSLSVHRKIDGISVLG